MIRDSIVAEIHKKRAAQARRFHYDLHAICTDIRKRHAKTGYSTGSEAVPQELMRVAESRSTYTIASRNTKRTKSGE